MGTYGSARVAARQGTGRLNVQRFAVGVAGGVGIQLLLAFLLGWLLAGGATVSVQLFAMFLSSVIATPLTAVLGFTVMLRAEARPFGGGILVGDAIATLLLVLIWLTL